MSTPLTIKELSQKIKDSTTCEELQKIFDRGVDGFFSEKEAKTFELLIDYVRSESHDMMQRACAVLRYDMMMGQGDSTIEQWCKEGEEVVVKDFIESLKDC
jgi:hypothetical protein